MGLNMANSNDVIDVNTEIIILVADPDRNGIEGLLDVAESNHSYVEGYLRNDENDPTTQKIRVVAVDNFSDAQQQVQISGQTGIKYSGVITTIELPHRSTRGLSGKELTQVIHENEVQGTGLVVTMRAEVATSFPCLDCLLPGDQQVFRETGYDFLSDLQRFIHSREPERVRQKVIGSPFGVVLAEKTQREGLPYVLVNNLFQTPYQAGVFTYAYGRDLIRHFTPINPYVDFGSVSKYGFKDRMPSPKEYGDAVLRWITRYRDDRRESPLTEEQKATIQTRAEEEYVKELTNPLIEGIDRYSDNNHHMRSCADREFLKNVVMLLHAYKQRVFDA